MMRMMMFYSATLAMFLTTIVQAETIRGYYLESRTCQVYTGPCFANAEFGLTGNDAIMAWHIEEGTQGAIDVAGLSVIVVVHASDTLASAGIGDAKKAKSVILVDEKADASQRDALIEFAKSQTGKAGETVARIESMPIQMSLDLGTLEGHLEAGKAVKMVTRGASWRLHLLE